MAWRIKLSPRAQAFITRSKSPACLSASAKQRSAAAVAVMYWAARVISSAVAGCEGGELRHDAVVADLDRLLGLGDGGDEVLEGVELSEDGRGEDEGLAWFDVAVHGVGAVTVSYLRCQGCFSYGRQRADLRSEPRGRAASQDWWRHGIVSPPILGQAQGSLLVQLGLLRLVRRSALGRSVFPRRVNSEPTPSISAFPRVDLVWDVIKPSALWHRQMASLYNDVRYTRPPLIECRAKCSRPHRHHKQQRGDSIDNQNVLGSFTAPIAREGGFATGGRLHLVHPVSCLGDRSRQGLR